MKLKEKDMARLIALVNDLEDARQTYDDAVVPERIQLHKVLEAGDNLSNVAYELHNFLVLRLTEISAES